MADLKPIFPDIQPQNNGTSLIMQTYLRKKHKKIWYTQRMMHQYILKSTDTLGDVGPAVLGRFVEEIYTSIIITKVDLGAVFDDSTPVFEVDENQDEEKDRLIKKYGLVKDEGK